MRAVIRGVGPLAISGCLRLDLPGFIVATSPHRGRTPLGGDLSQLKGSGRARVDGAFMEPRGRNRGQSEANASAAEIAETSQIRCDGLPPVAVWSASDPERSLFEAALGARFIAGAGHRPGFYSRRRRERSSSTCRRPAIIWRTIASSFARSGGCCVFTARWAVSPRAPRRATWSRRRDG